MTTMLHHVRHGVLAYVGRFRSADATCYPRGSRVILRTRRGLEVGEVLAPPDHRAADGGGVDPGDGVILRGMTVEDEWLEARLAANRDAALAACARRLAELGIAAPLVDVEHLFDGRRLYFYFLGDVPPAVDALTDELAAAYDAQVHFRRFAETLAAGCGPGCGTETTAGCGSCASGCAVASACHAGG